MDAKQIGRPGVGLGAQYEFTADYWLLIEISKMNFRDWSIPGPITQVPAQTELSPYCRQQHLQPLSRWVNTNASRNIKVLSGSEHRYSARPAEMTENR